MHPCFNSQYRVIAQWYFKYLQVSYECYLRSSGQIVFIYKCVIGVLNSYTNQNLLDSKPEREMIALLLRPLLLVIMDSLMLGVIGDSGTTEWLGA